MSKLLSERHKSRENLLRLSIKKRYLMKKEHSTTRSVIFTPHNTRKIAENKKIMVGYECTLGKKELLKTEISI